MKQLSLFNKPWRALCLIVFTLFASLPAWATVATIDGITYNIENGVASVTGIDSPSRKAFIEIPESVTYSGSTYNVTSLSTTAFDGCSNVTDIVLPETVSSIAISAFSGCTDKLTALLIKGTNNPPTFSGTLPTSRCVLYIDNEVKSKYEADANWSNYDMKNSPFGTVYIVGLLICAPINSHEAEVANTYVHEESTYTIPTETFKDKNNYTFSVVRIANGAFENAKNLRSIVIPSNIREIDTYAFAHNNTLKFVAFDGTLPDLKGVAFPKLDVILTENLSSTSSSFNPTHIPLSSIGRIFTSNHDYNFAKSILDSFGSSNIVINSASNGYYIEDVGGTDYWIKEVSSKRSLRFPTVERYQLKGTVTIPASADINSISSECFQGYNKITSFVFSEGLTGFSRNALNTGSKLATMTFPSTITTIVTPLCSYSTLPDTLFMAGSTPPTLFDESNNPSSTTSLTSEQMPLGYLVVPDAALQTYKDFDSEISTGWGEYEANHIISAGSLVKKELTEADMDGADVILIDNTTFQIGDNTGTYSNQLIEGRTLKSLKIMKDVEEITLKNVTVNNIITDEKSNVIINFAGKDKSDNFINYGIVTIYTSGTNWHVGNIENHKELYSDDGNMIRVDSGEATIALVTSDMTQSFETGKDCVLVESANIDANHDVEFIWYKRGRDKWDKIQTNAYNTNNAAGSTLVRDELKVSEAGAYRCEIICYNTQHTVISSLTQYGTVTETKPAIVKMGRVTLKTFSKGYFEGFKDQKDAVIYVTSDSTINFRLLDKSDKVIEIASVYVKYDNTPNDSVQLTADKSFVYHLYPTAKDTVTVYVDSCSPVANEITFANDVKIWGSRGVLHISAPQAVKASIISLDGKQNIIRSEAGDQQFYLGQGVFIIRIGDKAWKIRL